MIGPVGFVAAWALLGGTADHYDPARDAISRLAALDAPTRPAMTAGLLGLAAGMGLYGLALRPHRAWPLPMVNAATTLAVAALPLGGGHDTAHGVAATLGYATLASIPVVIGPRVPVNVVTGLVSGFCLLASVVGTRDGLFQRTGLTVAQLWVVLSALGLLRRPTSSSTTPPAPARAARRR